MTSNEPTQPKKDDIIRKDEDLEGDLPNIQVYTLPQDFTNMLRTIIKHPRGTPFPEESNEIDPEKQLKIMLDTTYKQVFIERGAEFIAIQPEELPGAIATLTEFKKTLDLLK